VVTSKMPDWAVNMTDLHVHAAPSIMPRHGMDPDTVAMTQSLGFEYVVLKSHEGSTAERAALAASSAPNGTVVGGVVLNSAAGGANPDAVEVAGRLGARVIWMPTVSSENHVEHQSSSQLSVHREFQLKTVLVTEHGKVRSEWYEVLDAVARHDMVLASGHLKLQETIALFTEARERGVTRLLVNHPRMPFIGWDKTRAAELVALGAHLELGILPDIVSEPEPSSITLGEEYPAELLVFGGDLGHADYPTPDQALPGWLAKLEALFGEDQAVQIMTANGRQLVSA
jgi:hypothetical protein